MTSNRRIIQVPVTLNSANRKTDRSVKFAFTTTKEISTDEYMIMDGYHLSNGWLIFAENELNESDIPDEDVETDTEKSQSVQIRDALWVLYKAKGGDGKEKGAWTAFYRKQMQFFKTRILEEVHQLEDK